MSAVPEALHIRSAGMVTAVGLDAPSTCAALRARLDGFRETRFVAPDREWLIGAEVPLPRQWIGRKRMAHLAAGAVVEVLKRAPGAEASLALILCLSEEDRPGRPVADPEAFVHEVARMAELPKEAELFVLCHGRPSGFAALDQARRMLASGRVRHVVVASVDSYLTGQSIAHYLAENRILGGACSNGFIPGEAAAAVLCTAEPGGIRVSGLGMAREAAYIYNRKDEDGQDLPLRADGMVAAVTKALGEAGRRHSEIVLKIGDLIGEAFWFRQSALTMMRVQRERSEVRPIWALGASLGNVGSAAVPVMLGWVLAARDRGYAPAGPILLEASGDDGACGAVVAEAT